MEILIDKITKAINFAFKSDGTCPGLTISWIPHTKNYYVSIVRWTHGEKIVVASANAVALEEALLTVAQKFVIDGHVPVNPIDELSDFIIGKGEMKDEVAANVIPYNLSLS